MPLVISNEAGPLRVEAPKIEVPVPLAELLNTTGVWFGLGL